MSTYQSVQDDVSRTHSLVSTAKALDNAEMYLVLSSDILTSMACTYRAALSMAQRRRDVLFQQLDGELNRIAAALGVLRQSREVPARLAEAQVQWRKAADHVHLITDRVVLIENRDSAWTGRARNSKTLAVERQREATEQFAVSLTGLGSVTARGQALMESVFVGAAVSVTGCNTQLGGFVHRGPSAHVGLWGLFSRSNQALWHLRSTANFMTRHVSADAPWRGTSAALRRQADAIGAGTDQLPASGWPEPVAQG